MASNTITYNRGTTRTIQVDYSNANGIDGATAFMTVKSDVDSDADDSEAIFHQNVAMVGNSGVFTISPTDFPATVPEADYVYDVKVKDANNAIYLVTEGAFQLNVSATNRTS